MTAPDHLDDEQLTALQDGEGSPEERAHLDGCDRCADRARALAAVSALVATPPPAPSPDAREAAVVAALAGADRPAVGLRPAARRRVPAWLLPAAAVVALLALVVAVVPRLTDRSDSDSAASGQRTNEGAESADDDAGGAGGGSESNLQDGARAQATARTDLGAVEDERQLAERVDAAMSATAAADRATSPADDPCTTAFRAAGSSLGPLQLRASLVWRGQPAEVLVDGERAVVVAAGGCTTLASVDLP